MLFFQRLRFLKIESFIVIVFRNVLVIFRLSKIEQHEINSIRISLFSVESFTKVFVLNRFLRNYSLRRFLARK